VGPGAPPLGRRHVRLRPDARDLDRQVARFWRSLEQAQTAFERGNYALSAQLCEQALVQSPHDRRAPFVCRLEGIAQLNANHLDEASYALERAWRTEPLPEVALYLVEASARRGDAKAARSWAEACRRATEGHLTPRLREELTRLASVPLDPETRAAVAAIGSR
jgi:ATP/maltotriose-dependent transcriptional regulator MalT